ncbi:MAG: CpaF family protein, partial [Roseobacter sp.]
MFREFIQSNSAKAEAARNVISITEPQKDIEGEKLEAERKARETAELDRIELKARLHNKLLDALNLAVLDKIEEDVLRREVGTLVTEGLREEGRAFRGEALKELIDELMHEVLGLGPLEPLLADNTINDILVNGHNQVYIERSGVLELSTCR